MVSVVSKPPERDKLSRETVTPGDAPQIPPRLLPDDPEEVRRIYRALVGAEGMESARTADFDESYLALARTLDVLFVLTLPLVVPVWGRGLPSYALTVAGYAALALATYALYHVLGRALLRWRYGPAHPYVARPGRFYALGPISLVYLLAVLPRRVRPERVDPTSLDVLEPVARAVAAPLLREADAARTAHADATMTANAALARLDALLTESADPETAAAEARRAALLAEAAAARERLARIEAEAAAVRATLARLKRRRELQREMSTAPLLSVGGQESGDALRANLAALAASLDAAARLPDARLAAENELNAYLADPGSDTMRASP